ncbi:DUF1266 domain-containing protein [[Clostridium] colinum]|uniref:DUF1266 domain-containing protein n=1 Tax=[Clostridium] colinum TaxID=36835 RepID=UPI002024ED61|nr:DUF1266 domain-containing protein [[Clostridium] colinum]
MSLFKKLFNFKRNNNKSNYNEKNISDVIYWQNATYAILTTINHQDVRVISGYEKNDKNKKIVKDLIEKWWGIYNRKDLLEMIEKLKNGLHNNDFLETIEQLGIKECKSKDEFILKILPQYKEESHNLFLIMYDIWQKNKKYGDEPIIAWDFSRAIYLCHEGYVVDYLSYEEALSMALELCKKLQAKFNNWDELIFNYLDGYQYWSQELMCNPLSDASQRIKIYLDLKSQPDSIYNIDWNLELKREW